MAERKRSGSYVIDEYVDLPGGGRKRIQRQGFRTLKERNDAFDKIKADLDQGVDTFKADKVTVRQLGEMYAADKASSGRSGQTVDAIRTAFNRINLTLGDVTLSKLTTSRPIDLLRDGMLADLKPGTVRLYLRLLRGALSWAVKKRLIVRNVALESDPPPEDEVDFYLPTHAEIGAAIDVIGKAGLHHEVLAELLAHTGLRISEALGLRWEDIDAKGITVRKHAEETSKRSARLKTASARRTLSLGADELASLNRLRDRALVGGGWVFVDAAGHRVSYFAYYAQYRKANDKLSWHVHPHLFRHYHASACIETGMDFYELSKRLGHKTIAITLGIYGHLRPHSDQEGAARASALLRAAR